MNAPLQHWKVLPHDKLAPVTDNIMTVTGKIDMPLMALPRRMTLVRLAGGGLVVYSAIALDEEEMAALESWGKPAFLVVPGDHHRLDARVWKDRYPAMLVVAPEGARAKVSETVLVNTVSPDFDDPLVQFIAVPGTRGHEAALMVRSNDGSTLILNDLVGNIRHPQGFGGWLLKLAGFAGEEAQIPAVIKLTMVHDKQALRTQLLHWADMESLKRIVVSHGDIIKEQPQQVLRELAASLE